MGFDLWKKLCRKHFFWTLGGWLRLVYSWSIQDHHWCSRIPFDPGVICCNYGGWNFWNSNHTSWWFQPIWKILVKLEIFPKSGSQYFKKEMLSENAQIRILKASAGIGICSKCRWQSGCLECSGQHAFKYHMGKEALSKNKIPSYTGHGVGGGITYHHHHHHHHHPPSCIIITIHIHSFLSLLLLLLANAKNQWASSNQQQKSMKITKIFDDSGG